MKSFVRQPQSPRFSRDRRSGNKNWDAQEQNRVRANLEAARVGTGVSADRDEQTQKKDTAVKDKTTKQQKAAGNREWVDLDKYIELLLDSKSEDEIVFIYCNPNENGDPYDLQVCSYDDRNEDKYYTLSGKGLSVHEGDHLTDFISLAQWLLNRDSYNHIKELTFFKKFKSGSS